MNRFPGNIRVFLYFFHCYTPPPNYFLLHSQHPLLQFNPTPIYFCASAIKIFVANSLGHIKITSIINVMIYVRIKISFISSMFYLGYREKEHLLNLPSTGLQCYEEILEYFRK